MGYKTLILWNTQVCLLRVIGTAEVEVEVEVLISLHHSLLFVELGTRTRTGVGHTRPHY
jgi:hypothetical protein